MAKISLRTRNPKNKKNYRAELAIIDEDYTPLRGSSAAQQMGLITVQQENILQVKESYQELNTDRITQLSLMSLKVWAVWKELFT